MTTLLIALAIALLLDAAFGEPRWIWTRVTHPAVLMGRTVALLDDRLNEGDVRRARGVLAVAVLAATAAAIGWAMQAIPWAGPVLATLWGAVLLAQRSLAEHVAAVAAGLDAGLAEGRQAVSMIVGRDPETLDEAGVARAAIESAAENFSDGVVAPAFWFAVAGLPGVLVYKAVNTADSMIGHRTERHLAFGWATARLDDALNLIPARLSALLIAAASGSARPVRIAWRDAALHRSPNAGWPEAAAAAALGVALAGPRTYGGRLTDDPLVHPEGRAEATADDIRAAVRLIWRAWGALLALVGACAGLALALE